MALFFRSGEFGTGGLRFVFCKPVIAFKNEGFRKGSGTNIHIGAEVGATKDEVVVFENDVATRGEAGGSGFLQDAKQPLLRVSYGVVGELGSVHTDKSDSAWTPFDGIAMDDDVLGLMKKSLGTEKGKSGGTSDMDGPGTAIDEVTVFDTDVGCAAFELDSCTGTEAWFSFHMTADDF